LSEWKKKAGFAVVLLSGAGAVIGPGILQHNGCFFDGHRPSLLLILINGPCGDKRRDSENVKGQAEHPESSSVLLSLDAAVVERDAGLMRLIILSANFFSRNLRARRDVFFQRRVSKNSGRNPELFAFCGTSRALAEKRNESHTGAEARPSLDCVCGLAEAMP